MQTLDTLGAGFTLASHDLDIRGAGNLLGEEQSGHIREVGVELYQQLLEEAVPEARGAARTGDGRSWTPQINLGMPVLIPESYVADLGVRLGLYRRIGALVDRGGDRRLRRRAGRPLRPAAGRGREPAADHRHQAPVPRRRHRQGGGRPEGRRALVPRQPLRPAGQAHRLHRQAGGVISLRPDHKLVYRQAWDNAKTRVAGVHKLMEEIARLAA